MQKSVEDILRKVAERQNVSLDLVKNIWTNQWRYAAFRFRCGKRGNYKSFRFVYLPCLMRFYTAEKKINKMYAASEAKKRKTEEAIDRWKEDKMKKENL